MYEVKATVQVDHDSLVRAMKNVYIEDMVMCKNNYSRLLGMQATSELADFQKQDAKFDREMFYALDKVGEYYYGDGWHSIDDSIFDTEILRG